MKLCALLVVLTFSHILAREVFLDRVPCLRPVYYGCRDYCRWSCRRINLYICLSECWRGCGCYEGFVMHNAGGCDRIDPYCRMWREPDDGLNTTENESSLSPDLEDDMWEPPMETTNEDSELLTDARRTRVHNRSKKRPKYG